MDGDDKKKPSVEVSSCSDESENKSAGKSKSSISSFLSDCVDRVLEKALIIPPYPRGTVESFYTQEDVVSRITGQHGENSINDMKLLDREYLKDFFDDLPREYVQGVPNFPSESIDTAYRVRDLYLSNKYLNNSNWLLDIMTKGVNIFDGDDLDACKNLRSKLDFPIERPVQDSSCQSGEKA